VIKKHQALLSKFSSFKK